jgi:hypothetical protein
VYRIAMILFVAVSCPLLAAEERNCDPRAGLIDGSCHVEPPRPPWWTCSENTYLTPQELQVTAEQQRRLDEFGLSIFSPALPGYRRQDSRFTRSDLIKRFGQPLSTRSKERLPYDPTDPMEIVTTWEYRGFRITTVASKPNPEVFWLDEGEIFDARVSLRYGVRVGQSIHRWVKQFGRPNCSEGVPQHGQRHLFYDSQYYSAQIELYLDPSGKVQRMRWSYPMM